MEKFFETHLFPKKVENKKTITVKFFEKNIESIFVEKIIDPGDKLEKTITKTIKIPLSSIPENRKIYRKLVGYHDLLDSIGSIQGDNSVKVWENYLLMKIDNCVEGVLDYVSDHAVKNAIISNKSEVKWDFQLQ